MEELSGDWEDKATGRIVEIVDFSRKNLIIIGGKQKVNYRYKAEPGRDVPDVIYENDLNVFLRRFKPCEKTKTEG